MPRFINLLKLRVPKEIAEAFIVVVKRRIETQDLPSNWFLLKRYQDKKKRKGFDKRILIASGQMLEALTAVEVGPGHWVAGIPEEAGRHKGAQFYDVLITDVLKYMEDGEYNSTNPHPRPILHDTVDKEQDRIRQQAISRITELATLYFYGLVVPKSGLSRLGTP